MKSIDVALSCDRNFLIGLYVTSHTLLKSINNETRVNLHLFLDGISEKQISRYQDTISRANPEIGVQFFKYDISDIKEQAKSLNGLHGNTSPYYLLFLPSISENLKRFIWLDVDTIVNCDVSPAYFDETTKIISAVPHKQMRFCGERKFYESMNICLDDYEFNSGFLVVNAEEWRKQDVTSKLLPMCHVNAHLKNGADQGILNVFFNKNFHELDKKYNVLFGPTSTSKKCEDETYTNKVCHFFGSPKPWERVVFTSSAHSRYYEKIIKELKIADLRFNHLYSREGIYRYSRLTIRSLVKSLQLLRKIKTSTIRKVN